MKTKILAVSLLIGRLAYAWGEIGHGAVGEIAERNLTPKAREMVYSILGPEPLAIASAFSDKVRSDVRYKIFDKYHYMDIPVGHTFEDRPAWSKKEKSADTFLAQIPALLKDKKLSRDRKMIWLRYLAHIVGDIHQPLHVGNGLDRGANLCDVWWKPGSRKPEKVNLHWVWDDNLIGEIRYQNNKGQFFGYQELVRVVLKDTELTEKEMDAILKAPPQRTVWYKESAELRETIYPEGIVDPKLRPYCKYQDPATEQIIPGNYEASRIPTVGDDYNKKFLPKVKTQLLKGGLRLAALLNEIAKDYQGSTNVVETEAELFKALELKGP